MHYNMHCAHRIHGISLKPTQSGRGGLCPTVQVSHVTLCRAYPRRSDVPMSWKLLLKQSNAQSAHTTVHHPTDAWQAHHVLSKCSNEHALRTARACLLAFNELLRGNWETTDLHGSSQVQAPAVISRAVTQILNKSKRKRKEDRRYFRNIIVSSQNSTASHFLWSLRPEKKLVLMRSAADAWARQPAVVPASYTVHAPEEQNGEKATCKTNYAMPKHAETTRTGQQKINSNTASHLIHQAIIMFQLILQTSLAHFED